MDFSNSSGFQPEQAQFLKALVESTPARIAVARTGCRPRQATWLKFRLDHAMARDAVHSQLSSNIESWALSNNYPLVQTSAVDRHDFVAFPPKGKRLSETTLNDLAAKLTKNVDVQIVISDGLSAQAVEANIQDLLPMLLHGFKLHNISVGTPVVVRLGRVAVADQIGHAAQASLAINLIGERPGLSSAAALSAYLTYNPGPSTISSDRTVVSNIHSLGTPPAEAGAYIVQLCQKILAAKVSGVGLQQLG